MNSIRQIAIQLPEGLQRLQLHLFANGLVGWSPEAEDISTEATQTESQESHNSTDSDEDDGASQTPPAQLNLRTLFDHLNNTSAAQNDSDNDHSGEDSSDHGSDDFADVASGNSEAEDDSSSISDASQHGQGMSDEEQIGAVQAFIVGDDTENPDLIEAAWMAATQLVSSLADSSDYIEPEVIDTLLDLHVHLHAVEGGLQLKIGHGVLARSIYIYGDDDDDDSHDNDDNDSDEDGAVHGGASGRAVVEVGGAASEEGVSCPVCLSAYSSNVRMAALGCHHHLCNSCFGRLSRPKLCPICRARIASHVEVIL